MKRQKNRKNSMVILQISYRRKERLTEKRETEKRMMWRE